MQISLELTADNSLRKRGKGGASRSSARFSRYEHCTALYTVAADRRLLLRLPNVPLGPPRRLDAQLDRGLSPVLPMVVSLLFLPDARTLQRLLIRVAIQDAVNHRHTRVELDPHQAVRDGVGDVFKVLR